METETDRVSVDSPTGRLVIATTALGSAVAMLTASVVSVALPSIASDFGASSAEQQWIVNAYLLTVAALILIGGSLGDRYGRVRIYRIGVIWFALASLGAALAPTTEWLILFRLLMGIGGGLLTPGSLSIIEATLRKPDRGRGIGRWSGLTSVAGAVGPLVGGLLIEASWRWVFVINIPIAVAVLVLTPGVPETSDPEAADTALDVSGALLSVLALGAASFTMIEGPNDGFGPADWTALSVAIAATVGLVVVERNAEHPIVPFELFANRAFTVSNTLTLLVYGGMGLIFFLLAIQLQVTAGWSPLAAGAALLPVTVLLLVLSPTMGNLAQKIGPRWLLTVGPALIAAGMLLCIRIGPGASFLTDVLPAMTVFGLGLSISVAPVTATALASVPEDRSGAASGANNAIARTGQLVSVAAVPPLVGLTGDALSVADKLNQGFGDAMVIGAILVGMGGLTSALGLRRSDLTEDSP